MRLGKYVTVNRRQTRSLLGRMKTFPTDFFFVLQIGLQVDVLFSVDASSSVWAPDFRNHLGLVTSLIRDLWVEPDAVRCGLMTYADDVRLEFGLRTHSSWEAAVKAVSSVRQQRGNTRTDLALRRMRVVMEEEGRVGVARVGVVITDGRSHLRWATLGEAAGARREGIAVFVVGVGGDLDREELRGIAGGREELMFQVAKERDVEDVSGRLAEKICGQAEELHDYLDPTMALSECGTTWSPDVTFLLDLSIVHHPDNLEFGRRFVRNCASLLSASNAASRVTVVTYGQSPRVQFELDDFLDTTSLLRAISRIPINDYYPPVTDLSGALRALSGSPYLGEAGRVVVVVIGGRVGDLAESAALAGDLRGRLLGGTMIFVGVGSGIDPEEMKKLAGFNLERGILLVESYRSLGSVALELLERMCETGKKSNSPTFSSFPPASSIADNTKGQTGHKIQSQLSTGTVIRTQELGVTSHPISTTATITNSTTSSHELSAAASTSNALNFNTETPSSSMSTGISTVKTSTSAGATTTSAFASRDNWPFVTPNRRPNKTPDCDFVKPADVVFSLPDQMAADRTDEALRFVAISAADLHLDGFNVRMGLTPRLCPPSGGFPLGDAAELDRVIAAQRTRPSDPIDTGLASRLSYLRRTSFGREELKGHYGAVLVAVLVLDRWRMGGAGDGGAVREANLLKDQDVVVLGVAIGGRERGRENLEEMTKIVSCSGCLFSGDSLDERLVRKLAAKINELRCNR